MPRLSIIAAMDRNRLIGRDNQLPWRLPADLQHFKQTTMGCPILMGRKTWESLGRPLPGRTNIAITRNEAYTAEGAVVVHSLGEALQAAGDADEVFIIGGANLYEQALAQAERLYLTEVDGEFDGDAWFPRIDPAQWQELSREFHTADARNPHDHAFVVYERVRP